jgi:pimeloyl-ACP methyl ester carboxylesterase
MRSIEERGYRRLGGINQWVMICGDDVDKPPLILLHGGPGLTETLFFRHYNAVLERHFTVVYWDQRGAGRSFVPTIPTSSMTLEQFVADLDELVEAVRDRLGKEKVALFGHSWGSALGVLYAARFPEKVAAYVGSGQLGDWPASERATYDWTLVEAERRGERRILDKLRAIGPPPHTAKQLWVQRMALGRLDGLMSARAMWKMARLVLGARDSSILDLPRTVRGFRFSIDAMWSEVSALDLMKLAPELRVPVFFLLGRNDHFVAPRISVDYFEALHAPSKQLVWFEKSGHEPFVDEPDKFNAAMVTLVRPVAAGEAAAACDASAG